MKTFGIALRNFRGILALAVLSAVFAGAASPTMATDAPAASSAAPEGGNSPTMGKAANFRGVDLAGKKVSLDELLTRGPVLIDFWATWCKPCLKELPHLQRLHEKYSEKGLQVITATIDSPKTEASVKPFVLGKKYTFPVILDSSQEVFKALQGKGTIPYVVAIDRDGNIRYRHTGYRPGDENELERVALELLGLSAPSGETPAEASKSEESGG